MYVIIAGCGRAGSQIAITLSEEGHNVVVIDKDEEAFERLGGNFNGVTVQGLIFDEETLLEAGADQADAFVAVSSYDNTNLMAAEIARSIFRIPRVLSRLYYVERELTFFKLGIDYISSTAITTDRFREKLFQGSNLIFTYEEGVLGLKLLEIRVSRKISGRPVREIADNMRLVALLREGELEEIAGGVRAREGDRILVALREEGQEQVLKGIGVDIEKEGSAVYPAPTAELMEGTSGASKIVIAGCSAVGAHLAYTLSMEGHEVTIVDEDPKLFERVPPGFSGRFVEGVVYEEEVLRSAGIEQARIFAVLTKYDNRNMMAAEVARRIFKVPKVVARLFNIDKESTYQSLEIEFVSSTRLLAEALLDSLLDPVVKVQATCFNNMYDVVAFDCPPRWWNREVGEFERKMGFRIAYLEREGSGILPDGEFVLRKDDILTALMTPRVTRKLDMYLKKTVDERGDRSSLS